MSLKRCFNIGELRHELLTDCALLGCNRIHDVGPMHIQRADAFKSGSGDMPA